MLTPTMKPEPFLDQGKNSKAPKTANKPSSKDKDPKIKTALTVRRTN